LKPFVVLAAVVVSITVLLLAGWTAISTLRFLTTSPQAVTLCRIQLRAGATRNEIGLVLERRKIIRSASAFAYFARSREFVRLKRGGDFWLDGSRSLFDVIEQLSDGGQPIKRVTIPEGFMLGEVAATLERSIGVSSDSVLAVSRDAGMVEQFAFTKAPSLEGFLFPETYFFDSTLDARAVVTVLAKQFHRVFTSDMARRAEQLGLTPLQAVTLASIIEKEAAVADERPVISQVFHTRLKRGMGLESDPTVKYALAIAPVNLSLRDIQIDSPYNTYRYAGLPPGPICNPGKAALVAALHPAETDYLYFVANWDGTHTFTRTLAEHNAAKVLSKRRYREWRSKNGS
jgi:UPF0755 protein